MKTPLQQNFVHDPESDEEENVIGEENHFFAPDDMPIFITEDEYSENSTVQRDENFILANETVLEEDSDEYQSGYMNALSAQQ